MDPNSLCDTHFHLNIDDDIKGIIERAYNNNVKNLIVSCPDIKSIEFGLELIKKYPVYLTIGIHPDEIDSFTSNTINYLESIIHNNSKIIGIGEIGLDYYHNKDNKEAQKKIFEEQLKLAKKMNLPVVIHSRDATEDTYNILKKYNLKTTIHCFSGSLEIAKLYIKEGYLLGIGGVLTFNKSRLKEYIKDIPLSNIVFETDSPYLTPVPFRGSLNEPKNISVICKYLSSIINISEEDLIKKTTNNVIKQYNL